MNELALKTASASGSPTATAWAQVDVFSSMYLLIVLEKDDEESENNLAATGKSLFLTVEDRYQKMETKTLSTFKGLLVDLDIPSDIRLVSLVAGMIDGEALYIGAKGGEVYLKRKGEAKRILSGE